MTTDPDALPLITLADVYETLSAPFPLEYVEIKPGAISRDSDRALALAYVDARLYMQRLDDVVGPDNWQVCYRPWGPAAVICRLQVLGVIREDVGEADEKEPNRITIAVAQSFKRACAAFGLGRYLYHVPTIWADYDREKKVIKSPSAVVQRMYTALGIGHPR